MEEEEDLIVVSMKDVVEYSSKSPGEKSQAKWWTSIQILIYWIEDPHNGVMYIGATKRGLFWRIQKHVRDHTHIGRFIKYLPEKSLTWSVTLFPCETIESAKRLERIFIEKACPPLNRKHNPEYFNQLGRSGKINS